MSTTSNNSNQTTTNSLAAQLGAGAGELALNIFDKLDKLKKKQPTTPPPTVSSMSSLLTPPPSSTPLLATVISMPAKNSSPDNQKSQPNNLISNLAFSFHKNQSQAAKKQQLVVIDDDEAYDDTNYEDSQSSSSTSSVLIKPAGKISSSQSVTSELGTKKPDVVASSLKTSISTVFDDLLKKKEQAELEAEQFKKKLLTKTKSIEFSFESLKNKVVNAQQQQQQAETAQPTNNLTDSLETSIIEENSSKQSTEMIINNSNIDSSIIESTEIKPIINSSVAIIIDDPVKDFKNAANKAYLLPLALSFLFVLIFMPKNYTQYVFIYLSGLINGAVVAVFIMFVAFKNDWIGKYLNSKSTDAPTGGFSEERLHNLLISTCQYKERSNTFDGVYKGWMNELREVYNPDDYFLNKTRSVYVNLDGTMLRLQTTTSRIPKRAVCGETIAANVSFNESRYYDLTSCQVDILPSELTRKRFWSKKYPLCLKGVKRQQSSSNAMSLKTSQSATSRGLNESESSDNTSMLPMLDADTLVLFARTDREKEEWYKLFKKASCKHLADDSQQLNKLSRFVSSPPATFSYDATNDKLINKIIQKETSQIDETCDALAQSVVEHTDSPAAAAAADKQQDSMTVDSLMNNSTITFINAFLIRVFADFFNRRESIIPIQNKIQNKLNKLNVPTFMETLMITDLNLGSILPLIKKTSLPWYDDKGLWVHIDIDYNGGIQMSLATKLNLMKLKTTPSSSSFSFKNDNSDEISSPDSWLLQKKQSSYEKRHLAITNSDEEDSPESSGDEYVHSGFNDTDDNKLIETVNPSKKLLNIVNKIASSNYFQKATENKYIKMAMENVSNCPLLLNVEVKKIQGTVALNIPTYPSDRIWYGFATNPLIVLNATPQVGEKEVSYSAISDWIAEKLKQEFQKVLVFPNMDDFYINILNTEVKYEKW